MARILVLLLLLPAIQAIPMQADLEFFAPATFEGTSDLTGTTAFFLDGDINIEQFTTSTLEVRVYQMQLMEVDSELISYAQQIPDATLQEASWEDAIIDLDGARIGISAFGDTALNDMPTLNLAGILAAATDVQSMPDMPQFPFTRSFVQADANAFQAPRAKLVMQGAIDVHIYGADVIVSGAQGQTTYQSGYQGSVADPTGSYRTHSFQYVQLTATGTTLQATINGTSAALGAMQNVRTSGRALVPLVDTDTVGPNGTILNGTWIVEGDMTFANIHVLSSNKVGSQMSGDITALNVNGNKFTWPKYGPEAAVATGIIGAIGLALWKGKELIGAIGLLTKPDAATALGHPRRKMLYEFIVNHPGASFRELLRENDIPAGTARHHLNVLKRADLIMVQPHHQTLRFFENHGKYDNNWEREVMLREPELAKIYRFVRRHEGCNQTTYLDEAQGWGWSRSTAQHRLKRLVESGLIEEEKMGRQKAYHAS